MEDAIEARLSRIYAAIDCLSELDLTKLKADVIETKTTVGFYQDFRGGLTDAQLLNLAHSAIYNIAHLKDHLKKWARANKRRSADVEEVIANSSSLSLLVDLSNLDKHSELRPGGRSGKSPHLAGINRVLRMTVEGNSGMALTLNADGTPRILGSGSAKAVVTADVLDDTGTKIAEFDDLVDESLDDWERLLAKWNIVL